MPNAPNGSIVQVLASDYASIGFGFFDPESQITCRIFHFTDGPDPDLNPDLGPLYWTDKIANAYALRKAFVLNNDTDSCRLIHAEGDYFPGLIIDIYGHGTDAPLAVIQLGTKGAESLAKDIVAGLAAIDIPYVFLKNAQNTEVQNTNGWLTQALPFGNGIIMKENGLSFRVDYQKGQKTGFFLDQRENRDLVKALSKGKSVLNAFGYTGGFSAYALAGGATEVVSVDISGEATATCEENVKMNFPDAEHTAIAADCFDYIRNCNRTFDMIVLDPPAFAKNARSVNNATRGYKELNMAALKALNPGGILFTFSCSQHVDRDLFGKILFGAAADTGLRVRILQRMSQPADHPTDIYHPEGEYLKGLVLTVL